LVQKKEKKRFAYAYTRISSRSQKSKYGLLSQRKDIKITEMVFGLDILRWYSDIETGKVMNRKDFTLMTQALKEHPEVKIVVLSRINRLGRDLREILNWYHEIEKLGVRLCVAETGIIDTSTINGRMSFYMMALFSEFELRNMRDQLQKGYQRYLAKKMKNGKVARRDILKANNCKAVYHYENSLSTSGNFLRKL